MLPAPLFQSASRAQARLPETAHRPALRSPECLSRPDPVVPPAFSCGPATPTRGRSAPAYPAAPTAPAWTRPYRPPGSAPRIARAPARRCLSACHREQIGSLDQLEALVHHRRGIDRNLPAHVPVRMRHRLFGGRGCAISGQRPCPERAAGCREDELFDIRGVLRLKHLKDRVVLAVERQTALPRNAHDRPPAPGRRRRPGIPCSPARQPYPCWIAARVPNPDPAAPTIPCNRHVHRFACGFNERLRRRRRLLCPCPQGPFLQLPVYRLPGPPQSRARAAIHAPASARSADIPMGRQNGNIKCFGIPSDKIGGAGSD